MRSWASQRPAAGSCRHGCPGIAPSRSSPINRWIPKADNNSSRTGSNDLQELHAELLREIEERKKSQARLLQRLERLSDESRQAAQRSTSVAPASVAPPPPPPSTYTPPPPTPYAQPPIPYKQPTPSPYTQPPPTPYTQPPPSTYPGSNATYTPPYMSQQAPPQIDFSIPEIAIEPDVPEPISEEPPAPAPPPPLAGPNVMNLVMVGAECAPWSKTGGLGDVMAALPKALARRGHRVMVVAPRYANYPDAWDTTVRIRVNCFGSEQEVGFFHAYVDGVDYVFVDHSSMNSLGNDIYRGSRTDIMFRCSLLSKAAIEAVWHVPCGGVAYGDNNLVFIANDWHTALLPVYLQAHYRDYGQMTYARCIFVIHNMAHQGRGPMTEVNHLELDNRYKEMYRLYDPVGGEHMNIMKVGLETAHRLVAVSHGYAWECLTPEGGWGLHQTLNEAKWKLRGIVNGIDTQEWNPALDKFLQDNGYTNYTIDTLREGKRQCKMALQKELGLPVNPDIPILGFIGRLDYQKGVDLIRDNYDWLMSEKVQLIMLGSGREDLENSLREMESRSQQQCRGWVGFSVKMAHRITAGVDILLMPSRFEPCGLNQLYAMAYGTVPVVHAVGGLRDTVQQYQPFDDSGTGWAFDRAEANKLREAISNALLTYRQYPDSFLRLMQRGMQQDLSWDHAAEQYEEVLVAAKYQW